MLKWFTKNKEKNRINEIRDFNIEQMQRLKFNNLELKRQYEKSKKYKINKEIKEICKIADKILEVCINDNTKIAKLNLFINYYQTEILKIISQYININTNNLSSDEAKKYIIKVESFISNVVNAFNRILEELVMGDNNINLDIRVMLKNLEEKNLIGEKYD